MTKVASPCGAVARRALVHPGEVAERPDARIDYAAPARNAEAPKLEHRLFCQITANWRGTPLATFETIVDRIGNTRTAAGLRVRAALDTREYPMGATVTKSQMDAVALVPDEFHGEWNYNLERRRS